MLNKSKNTVCLRVDYSTGPSNRLIAQAMSNLTKIDSLRNRKMAAVAAAKGAAVAVAAAAAAASCTHYCYIAADSRHKSCPD